MSNGQRKLLEEALSINDKAPRPLSADQHKALLLASYTANRSLTSLELKDAHQVEILGYSIPSTKKGLRVFLECIKTTLPQESKLL